MRELVEKFPEQLRDSIALGKSLQNIEPCAAIKNVVITGMGGSGIGGKIVSQCMANEVDITILANADYHLPNFVGANTLVIVSSYSGNTEETVEAMNIAIQKGCQLACISSGGEVKALAEKHKIPFVQIPGGNPPRAMFAYSFVQQLYVLKAFGVLNSNFESALDASLKLLESERENLDKTAKSIADKIVDRIPVLYSDTWLEGVLIRWRQQINENSKMLCWHHTFPEMNHNELVGWEGADNRIAVLMLKSAFDHPRSKKRMDICQPIFETKCDTIIPIEGKGKTLLEEVFYFVLFGDWLSIHLAELRKVDAVDIKNIIYLKNALNA